jgi:hypothetical protein
MRAFLVPRRLIAGGVILLATAAVVIALGGSAVANTQAATNLPLCVQHPELCVEQNNPWTWNGYTYTSGHDEPSLLFYSHTPGSGNAYRSTLTLPTDPPTAPAQDGTGGTWNFMLHPAFWFGMAMCDDQAAPNPTVPCPANSDKNIKTSLNPNSKNYIGLTPGSAFMEMQFYPPGWGPVSCTDANGNTDGKWCSALTIDSVQSNSNTGVANNAACNSLVGPEPVNWAMITKSGNSQVPANPAEGFGNQAVVTADTLEYNNGDKLSVNMHDTAAGFKVVIHDLTTGDSGSMTASIANGFGHALFQPNATTCTMAPYAFHPEFSTSGPNTRVLWAAHSYNVAFSDEIGHFEYCNAVTPNFRCDATNGYPNPTDQSPDPPGPLNDDRACFPAPVIDPTGATLLDPFIGCLASDGDFDGPEYQNGSWPGTAGADPSLVSTPIQFTPLLFTKSKGHGHEHGHGHESGRGDLHNYKQVAFETDIPRISGTDSSPNNDCQRHVSNPADPNPGQDCINPPNGASFYPIYTTNTGSHGSCVWQEGGASIPGTTNDFGGTSTAEFGGLLLSNYPAAGFTITQRFNNFHNTLKHNPCKAHTGD